MSLFSQSKYLVKSVPGKEPNALPIDAIIEALENDERVLFAYLYGSAGMGQTGNDIDIAVYTREPVDPHQVSADLKISLHNLSGLPPDVFDIRVLNVVEAHIDVFSLLYLRSLLEGGLLLLDRDPGARAQFLERYGFRFRECEGLIQEVLA